LTPAPIPPPFDWRKFLSRKFLIVLAVLLPVIVKLLTTRYPSLALIATGPILAALYGVVNVLELKYAPGPLDSGDLLAQAAAKAAADALDAHLTPAGAPAVLSTLPAEPTTTYIVHNAGPPPFGAGVSSVSVATVAPLPAEPAPVAVVVEPTPTPTPALVVVEPAGWEPPAAAGFTPDDDTDPEVDA
jgi:hypothetical protein